MHLAIRIPSWCEDRYEVKGISEKGTVKDGYLYLTVPSEETTIQLDFEMKPKLLVSDERVTENLGKVAVARGPIVYCAEEADNGKALGELSILGNEMEGIEEVTIDTFGRSEVALDVPGVRKISSQTGSSFVSSLYHTYSGVQNEKVKIRMIPYRLWANRGEGEMRVHLSLEQ